MATADHHVHTARVRSRLGSLLLFGGIGLLLLRAFQSVEGLPGMPRFWYVNGTMWWALALGSIAAGVACLWPQPLTPQVKWKPSRPGIRFQHVVVYTRRGCHLCDDALDLLTRYRRWLPDSTEVDIDPDPHLIDRYGTCVPVVLCDGKVRFRGRVSESLLQRLIEGTPPRGV